MVNTIQPREYFPISRIIPDPADTTTYYIRAVIRNAKTGVTIATVNLASQGNNLYANTWQAVPDPSGRGLFITITTSVYLDSGYTTKSPVYGEDTDTYLIYDRFNFVQALGSQIAAILEGHTGGADVDYKKIRKIMESVVKENLKTETIVQQVEAPKTLENDLVIELLGKISLKLDTLDNKENTEPAEKLDYEKILAPIRALESSVMSAVKSIEVSKPVELQPVIQLLELIKKGIEADTDSEILDNLAEIKIAVEKQPDAVLTLLQSIEKLVTPPEPPRGPRREVNRFGQLVERP